MKSKTKLILLCLILILFNLGVVSANDNNLTGDASELTTQDNFILTSDLQQNATVQHDSSNGVSADGKGNDSSKSINANDEKLNMTLTPVSTNILVGESFNVRFIDQNGQSYANLPVFIRVDGVNFKSLTDGDGFATFSINKAADVFPVELIYLGNARYNPYSQVVWINLQRYNMTLALEETFISPDKPLKVQFIDQFGKSYANLPVFIRVDGVNFKSLTDGDGFATFSINRASGVFPVELIYLGNGRYNPYSQVVNVNIQKYDATVSPVNTHIVGEANLKVRFVDQFGRSYANLPIFIKVDGKNFKSLTDGGGFATFSLDKNSGVFSVEIIYLGNARYNPYSKVVNVNLQKYNVTLTPSNTSVIAGNSLKVHFKDQLGRSYANLPVFIKIDGKTFKTLTDKKGYAYFDVDVNSGKSYSSEIIYQGNKQYNPFSKKYLVNILKKTSITILNDKLLKGGYLRVYLQSDEFWAVAKQTLTIKIGAKTFVEKTNAEGIVIIMPNLTKKNYVVDVTYAGTKTMLGSHKSKEVEGIYGYAIDPLYKDVPSKGNMPDIDYMTEEYVRADGDMTYTVLKSQYQEVLQRDSYGLFLTNKLTEYNIFKSKLEPTLYHLIHRTKWNVLERELFKELVIKNQENYWPSEITASLKGKAYTYSEVRDAQDTEYTCGPTSCSMCSQVLRSYLCESYLARLSGSDPDEGTPTGSMVSAMEKHNFKCTYFYRSSYESALDELKKGGCAVVFHTRDHYVALLDISKDGSQVLVSNSYGSYYDIPTGWLSTNYMKTRYYKNYDDGLIIRLSYSLSQKTKNEIYQFYSNMGSFTRQNTNENILVDY